MSTSRNVACPTRAAGMGLWLAVALVATGCGDAARSSAPADTPITRADVVGTYELRSIGGQGAPWVLATDGSDTRLAQEWTLAGDGTSTFRVTRRAADGGVVVSTGPGGADWVLDPPESHALPGQAVLRAVTVGVSIRYVQTFEYRVERSGGTIRLTLTTPGYPVYIYERLP